MTILMEEKTVETQKKTETELTDRDVESSPRGVLEIPVSGSESDQSSSGNSGGSSLTEKARWKNLFGNIKKKSGIPLLSGYESTRNSLIRRVRSRSASETIDCGEMVVAKPTWRNFSYQELTEATDNFSSDNLIGKGGHAMVYKGCLYDGQVVAVKRILKEEKTDEDRVGDFLSELGIIAHINHPNSVRLIGYSVESGLHLVLQFMPHGSLASALHGSTESLEWKIRYKVALGVADGLKYLHCECQRRIIHRDITASNILLTEDYEPQISDFGLAKWLPEKWVQHVVSPIEGTFGYMAPEYFMNGIVDEKTDVFAFGVLLLELITGRHAVDSCQQSLVIWAKPLLEKNSVPDIADPRLGNAFDILEMKRTMLTASSCLRHLPSSRPDMKRVVQLLRGKNGPADQKHKSFKGRAILPAYACEMEDYTSSCYIKDLNRHMQLVME
ncbi:receptor-like cytosolic serine/threonine-protein kinase RBK1 [Cornus florida]|uniref:receptor-like cytosolic serine/threonine-protein kinase RBK1 n=1 Tax=Cornus florida TaxID=4283 RepID=UPI0028971BF1|nr:receptor-like cytosolic serine/threonine-protein kinase RBK1 [Cornus florida]